MWVCGIVILYMRRSSEAVTRRACYYADVIWSGTPKRWSKIVLRWWRGQVYLAVNIVSRIISDIENWFNFLASEGYSVTRGAHKSNTKLSLVQL